MTRYLININNDCNQCMECVEVCQNKVLTEAFINMVIFDVFNVDVIEILQAKNFKGLRRIPGISLSPKECWELKTKTDTFKVYCGDLVVIDDDEKIIVERIKKEAL